MSPALIYSLARLTALRNFLSRQVGAKFSIPLLLTQVPGLDPAGLLLQSRDHFSDSQACLIICPAEILSLVHSYVIDHFDGVF